MTAPLETEVAGLIAGRPDLVANRYALYARMRQEAPVFRAADRLMLTRFADASRLLLDPRMLNGNAGLQASRARALFARAEGDVREQLHEIYAYRERWLTGGNGEHHARLRDVVHAAFTPRAIKRLEGRIQEIATALVDQVVASGRMDLIGDFAYHLPLMVVCELLGLPVEDRFQLRHWASDMAASPEDLSMVPRMRASIGALNEYLQKASRRRDRAPSELMDAMLTAVDASNPDFTEADFTAMLAFLIFAGHETTTNLIANGVHALLTYRDQWDVLRADPSVIPNAVEELLRFRSPVQALSRSAAEDMEVDGVSVKASDTVTLLLGAANHDPARFEDPERLDVTRDDVRHIGFGLGPHFCLGAALNRMETTIALTTLTERFPDLRLGTSSPVYRPVMVFMAFESLPVVLGRK